jgi:hypothetical protein
LSSECDELVGRLEEFCLKMQKLDVHIAAESSLKAYLFNTIQELELRIASGLKDPILEQQL